MLREARLKFTRELVGTLTVRSVSSDGILINDQLWSETVALTTQEIIENWPPVMISELTEAHFSVLLEHRPELIVVGTGKDGEFPPRELMFAFARRGVGLELMDTAAAARTFNVLAGEGRHVAAVLYRD
jgi:uncharacterized protein|tara:strand:- start:39 stop:425 length:387 start_codon:yes stop_codon:yes gene_type:complete